MPMGDVYEEHWHAGVVAYQNVTIPVYASFSESLKDHSICQLSAGIDYMGHEGNWKDR